MCKGSETGYSRQRNAMSEGSPVAHADSHRFAWWNSWRHGLTSPVLTLAAAGRFETSMGAVPR